MAFEVVGSQFNSEKKQAARMPCSLSPGPRVILYLHPTIVLSNDVATSANAGPTEDSREVVVYSFSEHK